jgi:glycosyltransferase involved in cell wall biosynthesis
MLSTVDPVGGGPLEAVVQTGKLLGRMGHVVEVLSLDDPASDHTQGFPLTLHALGPSASGYAYNPRLVPWLRQHATDYEAVVVNGLWQYHTFGAWRALHGSGTPYYVYPHGMLDPWFKRTYPLKHAKKWLYWPWAEYRVLRDAEAVLFTCDEERIQARQSFWLYRAREQVVAFGTGAPPADVSRLKECFLAAHPELRGGPVLLYLGRIHPKKGCDLLIRAFASVMGRDPTCHLVVAGPDQTGWAAELKQLAAALGVEDRIVWPGMLRDDMKWGAFYSAEAFILPSHQENFGVAVAEALGCGVPVMISDKVNIWREIAAAGAGIVESDDDAGTRKLLTRWRDLTGEQRVRMGAAALQLFGRQFTGEAMAASLLGVIADRAHEPAFETP